MLGRNNIKKTIVLVGDGAVGKTSLIRRFVVNQFDDKYIQTIGSKVSRKDMTVVYPEPTTLTLLIWDVLGQHGYEQVHRSTFIDADAAIAVCDSTRKETLDSLFDYWLPKMKDIGCACPVTFLVNKWDAGSHDVTPDAVKARYKKAFGKESVALESSAKDGLNVEFAFNVVSRLAVDFKGPKPSSRAVGDLPVKDKYTAVEATDRIMMEFVSRHGGAESAMPILVHQFRSAGVDAGAPSAVALKKAVEGLIIVDKAFRSGEESDQFEMRMHTILRRIA